MSGHTTTASYNATTWFVLLEQARLRHDYHAAANALDELERLGVSVRFRPVDEDAPNPELRAGRVKDQTIASVQPPGPLAGRGSSPGGG